VHVPCCSEVDEALGFTEGGAGKELRVAGLVPHGGVSVEVAKPDVFGRREVFISLI